MLVQQVFIIVYRIKQIRFILLIFVIIFFLFLLCGRNYQKLIINIMKKTCFLLLFGVIWGIYPLFSQENKPVYYNYNIADHQLLSKKILENPKVIDKYLIYEKEMAQMISNMKSDNVSKVLTTDTTQNGRKIIPVVFHIVHGYGNENISKAQIEDAIAKLNIDYQKLNSDTVSGTNTWSGFNSLRANCNFEFRLAKIDPNGNCTEGIDRVYDERTNYAYYDLLHDYAWNPKKYLNIYSVAFIYPSGVSLPDGAAIGGMSVFPPSNPLTPLFTNGDTLADGVLIRHDGIGSIGTATTLMGQPINALNRTFTHELGHYFNLYHPFQNLKLLAGLPVMGTDGCSTSGGPFGLVTLNNDEVADTPPIQTASQSTSIACFEPGVRNTCTETNDKPDMVENYMDYQLGYCTNIFTNGQNDRIQATMMSDRRQLWSYENLVETGVWDPNYISTCSPIADFRSNSTIVCAGSSVIFYDLSFNGTTSNRTWTFTGGTPSTSTDVNPEITYATPGTYTVKLVVANAQGSDSIIKINTINVITTQATQTGDIMEDFENGLNNWNVVNQGGNPFEVTDSASYTGTHSLRISNFANNPSGSLDELVSPTFDLSHITGVIKFKFNRAYVGKEIASNALAELLYGTSTADTIYDKLTVSISQDCGKTWSVKKTYSGESLTTWGCKTTSFIADSAQFWRQDSVFITGVTDKSNLRFKFTFTNKGGNNLYIDRICTGACGTVGISNQLAENINLSIYPNPIKETTQIQFNLTEQTNTNITLVDVLGRDVLVLTNQKLEQGDHQFTLKRSQFNSAGIYLVKIKLNNMMITRKLIVE